MGEVLSGWGSIRQTQFSKPRLRGCGPNPLLSIHNDRAANAQPMRIGQVQSQSAVPSNPRPHTRIMFSARIHKASRTTHFRAASESPASRRRGHFRRQSVMERPHQDSNLEPLASEANALSNCAMGTELPSLSTNRSFGSLPAHPSAKVETRAARQSTQVVVRQALHNRAEAL